MCCACCWACRVHAGHAGRAEVQLQAAKQALPNSLHTRCWTLAATCKAAALSHLAAHSAPPSLNRPFACRAWVQIVGEEATQGMSIACIGSTSARAAEKLGLQRIKVGRCWLLSCGGCWSLSLCVRKDLPSAPPRLGRPRSWGCSASR